MAQRASCKGPPSRPWDQIGSNCPGHAVDLLAVGPHRGGSRQELPLAISGHPVVTFARVVAEAVEGGSTVAQRRAVGGCALS
jgi:hypothetical protein